MFLKILASIRTNNFQDEHCIEKIQTLWQEQEGAVKEAFVQGEPVYAVYHDYASDYKGDYSLSICRLGTSMILIHPSRPIKYLRLIRRIRKRFFMLGRGFGRQKKQVSFVGTTLLTLKNTIPTKLWLSLLRLSSTKFSVFLP